MIGGQELLLIFIVTLILFGPKRIPEVARFLGKLSREIHKAIDEVKRELSDEDKYEG